MPDAIASTLLASAQARYGRLAKSRLSLHGPLSPSGCSLALFVLLLACGGEEAPADGGAHWDGSVHDASVDAADIGCIDSSCADASTRDASIDGGDDAGTPDSGPVACRNLEATEVSASMDDGNVPANVLDDDAETRWSADAVGAWIELEFPESVPTSAVSIAWYRGDSRRTSFEVSVSVDGETYRDVFQGWSSGETNEFEEYGFGETVEARFVRVTAYGNDLNDWASILELRAKSEGCATWLEDIYLLIGQSNMQGTAPIEAEDEAAPPRVYLLDDEGDWVPASNVPYGLNRYSSVTSASLAGLGPGHAFGRELVRQTGRRVGIISNARGGTSIAQWRPEGHEGDYALYREAVRRAQLALANHTGARIRGILWHQGESDNVVGVADYYVSTVESIVDGLREELDAPEAVFVAGEVGTWQGRGGRVNPEIRRIPDVVPLSGWVTSEGLTTHETDRDPWGPHFNSASQRILGERYADEVYRLAFGASE